MIERPEILDISDELPCHKRRKYKERKISSIRYIVVHHGAVPGDGREKLHAYANHHVNVLGWPGIGYHYGIGKDGTIYRTNRLEVISYHVGRYNSKSVGLVLVGHYDIEEPPQEQLVSARRLCAWLCQQLNLSPEDIKGHREFPDVPKSCPGLKISMSAFREEVRKLLEERPPKVIFEGKEIEAILIEGRTYVHLRELGELLNLKVEWDPKRRIITLSRQKGVS